jgi:hypothetical protein
MTLRPRHLIVIGLGLVLVAGWLLPFAVEWARGAISFRVVREVSGVDFLLQSDPITGLFERTAAITAALATVGALTTTTRRPGLSLPLFLLSGGALWALGERIRDHALASGFGSGVGAEDDVRLLQLGPGYWISLAATAILLVVIVQRLVSAPTEEPSRQSLPSGARSGG